MRRGKSGENVSANRQGFELRHCLENRNNNGRKFLDPGRFQPNLAVSRKIVTKIAASLEMIP